jgi:hypothetical protein
VTLRVLPGSGDGLAAQYGLVDSDAQAVHAEQIQRLADSFCNIPEGMLKRRYAEFVGAGMGTHQAVVAIWPQLATEGACYIATKVRNLGRDPRVRGYIEAIQRHGGYTAAARYEEYLERLEFEIDNPANSPSVRKDLLIALGEHLLRNGAAEKEGYQGTSKLGQDKGGAAAALPADRVDVFLTMLETEIHVPVVEDGDDGAGTPEAAGSR